MSETKTNEQNIEERDETPAPEEQSPAEAVTDGDEQAEVVGDERPEENGDERADSKPAREAARYRRRLREVEAERDRLREMLAVAQRTAVEQVAAGPIEVEPHSWVRLTRPGDAFTLAGLDPAKVHAEDGTLDRAAVGDALRALHAERPDLFARAHSPNGAVGPYIPAEGSSPGDGAIHPGFASAFGPRG